MKEDGSTAAAWLSAGDIAMSGDTLMLELKLGPSGSLLEQLALRKISSELAEKLELTLTGEELNEAVTAFYAERKLFGLAQISAWRDVLQISEAAIREYVRETALIPRLRDKLVAGEMVHERFDLNPHEFASAEVEVFSFSTEGAAREFMLAVHEKETEPNHGARRWLIRRETAGEAGALIFSTAPGELAGPVEIEYGAYEVYRIRHRERPSLTERLYRQIRDELFDEILKLELSRHPLKFLR